MKAAFVLAMTAGIGPAMAESGVASTYVDYAVACPGERFAAAAMVAAHRELPCGSLALVVSRLTGRRIVVRIVDRGPHVRGRIIDLSPAAARALGSNGLLDVRVEPVPENAPGSSVARYSGFEAIWRARIVSGE